MEETGSKHKSGNERFTITNSPDSFQIPDIGAELTGGCYGYATRYNHWPEQLVVGGTKKNESGHIQR